MRLPATAFLLVTFTIVHGAFSSAQVLSRATPPPERTAAGTEWYANRDPIFVLGNAYYPAGASRFFDGNTMVPATVFDGVPIYQDTTVEPFSLVFVPIGRGLVQPYELRRAGPLAATTGSRAPSFPVQTDAEAYRELPDDLDVITDPSLATDIPVPVGTSYRPCGNVSVSVNCPERPVRTSSQAEAPAVPVPAGVVQTAKAPEYRAAVWIEFNGSRWFRAGPSVPFDAAAYREIGQYYGTQVYRAVTNDTNTIYVSPVEGLVTPYSKTLR